jgi:hypothetical protein
MLALSVKFASAEGVGSIIEDVEPEVRSELSDAELLNCVRQSAFTIDFPESMADKRGGGVLTIPVGNAAEPRGPLPKP